MSFRSHLRSAVLGLATVLSLAVVPATASADTLHGPPRPGGRHNGAIFRRGHSAHRARAARTHRHARHDVRVRVHVHRHGHCRFVDGHYATRRRRVVVPGHHVERVIPARYEIRWRGHRYVHVLVEQRRVVREWVPARVEYRKRRVWVRGRWICS